ILFVNHHNFTGRSHLTAMVSTNNGVSVDYKLLIDERSDVSYPDVVEGEGGRTWMVYDRERYGAKEILMACFTEEDINKGRFASPTSYTRKIICKV
ncbi:MAG: exo-alpha-sialidase, partial [Clostridiaceae bacterium]|nr:exo-alpha-sialidase [Clostridiaceae bacterium]